MKTDKRKTKPKGKPLSKLIYSVIFPKSVPWVLSYTKTSTMSPIFCPSSLSKTQTAFWEFLPFHWFSFFLEVPSIRI
jgi:hypothetical protein